MAWNEILRTLVGGSLVVAQTTTPVSAKHVNVDELLAYQCGRGIATLVEQGSEPGPLFADGSLVFTSVETQGQSVILLVNAGYGNYEIPLEGSGVNRLRFEIPSTKGINKTYFLSYMHGHSMRSRYFDFAEGHPPLGRDEIEYSLVTARRAENLLPHLDYAIHETAQATLGDIVDGKFERRQLSAHHIENCDYLARQDPALAKSLQRSLDQLDMIVMGPKAGMAGGGRQPASMDKPVAINLPSGAR